MVARYGLPEGLGRREARGGGPESPSLDLGVRPGAPLPAVEPGAGEFVRGVRRGTGTVISGLARGGGAVARAVGLPGVAAPLEEAAQSAEQQLVAPNPARVSRLEDINWKDPEALVADVGDYLAGLAGSQLPVLGSMVAGGAAGAALRGPVGAAAGAGGMSALQQAGETAGAIQEDQGRPLTQGEAAAAVGAGTVAGALDALPVVRAAHSLGLAGPMKAAVRRGLLSRVAREGGTQALLEGGTEATQELVMRAARGFVNDHFDVLGPGAASDLLNAAAAGAIIGGGLGGLTGAVGRAASPEDLGGSELDALAADEQMRTLHRDELRSRMGLEPAQGSFTSEADLQDLQAQEPAQLREARDLEYQGFAAQHPVGTVESALERLRSGEQLSRREAASASEALRSLPDEELLALANRQDNQSPEVASLLTQFAQERGLQPEPSSGDLGSSLTRLEEGDSVVNYVDTLTRRPSARDVVLDENTGGFFRDSEHLSKSLAALERRNPDVSYERVPAREVLDTELEAMAQRRPELSRQDLERQLALNELQARALDPGDPLTREQYQRVRNAADTLRHTDALPEGTGPRLASVAMRLVDNPLSVFEGRFALRATTAPRAFAGADPLALTPEQLRPRLTPQERRQRTSERSGVRAKSPEDEAILQRYRRLRERKAIVRTPDQFKKSPNEREVAALDPEGKGKFIHLPNLVRQMVRSQRRLSGQEASAYIRPQEVVDGVMLGLAELRAQGYQVGTEGLIPDATVVWEKRGGEPITWGEVSNVGLKRLAARGRALRDRLEAASQRVSDLRERLRDPATDPATKRYLRGELGKLGRLERQGPELLKKQRDYYKVVSDARQHLLERGQDFLEGGREQTIADLEALGEGAEAAVAEDARKALAGEGLDEGTEPQISEDEQVDPQEFTDYLDEVSQRVARGERYAGPPTGEGASTPRLTRESQAERRAFVQEAAVGREVGAAIYEAINAPREQGELRGAEFDSVVRELGEAPDHQLLKARVKAWVKELKLPGSIKLLSTTEVLQELRARGDIGRIQRIRNGSLQGLTLGDAVWAHPDLGSQARLEVLAHELGHVVAARTAPQNVDAVYEAWQAWRAEQEKGNPLLRDVAHSKQALHAAIRNYGRADSTTLADLNATERAYVLDFEEWFADQVARHLAGDPSPVPAVRSWVQRFVEAMRKLFGWVRENGYQADQSVREFLTRMTVRPEYMEARVREAAEDGPWDDNEFYGAVAAIEPGSMAGFSAARLLLDTLSPSVRAALGRGFASDGRTRRAVARLLQDMGHHSQAEFVLRDVNAATIYGLQLWAHGRLPSVGPRTEGALGRFRDHIFELAGRVSEADQLDQALRAIRSGAGSTWVVSKVRRNSALQRSAQAVGDLWGAWLGPLVSRVMLPAYERMEATGNPYLAELARMFHNPPGQAMVQEGYLAGKQRHTDHYLDRLHRIFGRRPDAAQVQRVHEALQQGVALTGEDAQVQAQVRELLDELFQYMTRNGVLPEGSYHPGYYPRVHDVERLQLAGREWKARAADPAYHAGWDRIVRAYSQQLLDYEQAVADAEDAGQPRPTPNLYQQRALEMDAMGGVTLENVIEITYRAITNEYGTNDLDLARNRTGHNPFVPARNPRVLDFLYDREGPHREFFQDLLVKDLDQTLRAYIESVVKRTEFERRGGVSRVRQLIDQAAASGASEADLRLASDFVEAMQGTIGHRSAAWLAELLGTELQPGTVIDPRLQKAQSVILLWQNLRVLALAGFTSLADPVGILVRGGGLDEALASVRALRSGSRAQQVAHGLGITSDYAIHEALGGIYGNSYMVGKTKAWNDRFFKLIGLEAITRGTRVMATGAALQFLQNNLENQRYLDELGLEYGDVQLDEQGQVQILTREEIDRLWAEGNREEVARDQRVRAAINKFVDEAVLRPTAATRPVWASDPHFALIFHLKSFIYTFHSQILSRVWREGLNHGNLTPLLLLSVYVPFMVGADLLRDLVRYGPGGDPRKESWGVMDWVGYGTERAGLPGLASFLLDAQQDRQWGGIGIESALGPTVDSLLTLLDDVVLNNGQGSYQGLLDQLPGQNTPFVDLLR